MFTHSKEAAFPQIALWCFSVWTWSRQNKYLGLSSVDNGVSTMVVKLSLLTFLPEDEMQFIDIIIINE